MGSLASSTPDQRHLRLIAASSQANESRVRDVLAEDPPWTSHTDLDALRQALQKVAGRGHIPIARLLLEHGAEVDSKKDMETPAVFRASEAGYVRMVEELLARKASLNWQNRHGQTALFAACTRGHADVARILMKAGAEVEHRDLEGRTPMLVLASQKKQGKKTMDCFKVLLEHGADINARDDTGRTPLVWAATNGNAELVEAFLSGDLGKKADVAASNRRGRAALHLAAETNMEKVVRLLLENGAPVSAVSDGGWTALHNAAQNGHAKVVSLLVGYKARVNAQLSNGMTPLHWAAFNGHDDVVQILLDQPGVDTTIKDAFYRTPMLCAAERHHKQLAHLLSPTRIAHRLSPDAQEACKVFEAKVVDFNFRGGKKQLVFKHSIHDLLYGWDSDESKPRIPILPKNVKHQPAFRWIHLPANNISWVETLLAKIFIEGDFRDFEGFKALEKCFDQEHCGPLAHGHFMRSFCHRISPTADSGDAPQQPPEKDQTPPLVVLTEEPSEPSQASSQGAPELTPRKPLEDGSRSPRGERGDRSESKKKTKSEQREERHPKQHRRGKGPPSNPLGAKAAKLANKLPVSLTWETAKLAPSNGKLVVFMPFLHYETDERRTRMSDVIKRVRDGRPLRESSADALLVKAYLNHTPPLHPRRTLDQFFYHGIDTSKRDRDQVVYRYCKRHGVDPIKVFMVDQLWLWVISRDLVITCFPQRWDQRKSDPLNVLDGIIEETNAKTCPPITSVYDLAMLITARCSGIFDRHRLGDQEYQFLDMFESSIGHVTDRETRLFARFDRASALSSKWLQHLRRNHHHQLQSSGAPTADGDDEGDDKDPVFPDALLDIGVETSLLTEIKDIRDELNIIAHILDSQAQIVHLAETHITEELSQGNEGNRRAVDAITHEIRKRCRELGRLLDIHSKDIVRMDRQAESIYTSLTHLLDLKQKHSNALEARFARDQAVIAAKQGQTIMVFTIVTIIFLPMSFIATFFAINFHELETKLTIGYVSKYMFGIGLGISIPLVAMAFTVTDISAAFRRMMALLFKTPQQKTDDSSDDEECLEKHEGYTVRRSSVAQDLPRSRGPVRYDHSDGRLSPNYDREYEQHTPSRLSPVLARVPRARGYSASSGKAVSWSRTSYERKARVSQDLERGNGPGSPVRY